MSASVEYRKVSKSFGNTEVIKSLDMAIKAQEFVVLVGPSGCGKSTCCVCWPVWKISRRVKFTLETAR